MSLKNNKQSYEQLTETIQEEIEEYFQEMRPLLKRIAAEVSEQIFQDKFAQFQNVRIDLSTGVKSCLSDPPLPETIPGSRKHKVQRRKLSGTTDAALFKLFEEERRERGYNISRMLDVILWNYFTIARHQQSRPLFESPEVSPESE